MPTYEYECQSCGERFELFQSITAPPVRKCSSCGRMRVRRLVGTGAGILFKGSGFYLTDYRSESYKQAAKADKEAGGGKKEAAVEGEKKAAPSGAGGGKAAGSSEAGKTGPAGETKRKAG